MSRIALFNLTIGFWTLYLAAACGAFLATDLTATYIAEKIHKPDLELSITKQCPWTQ